MELRKFIRLLTGSSNGSENPALSVFDRFASVAQELLENLATSSPNPRADAILETTFEFSFQETVVVVGVYLKSTSQV